MKFEHTQVFNTEGALRGMRNPLNSWDRSDSVGDIVGPDDNALAERLIKGGSPHFKFLRQIFVSVDITAPLYWWSEMDTYKVGTTADSCSTMHTIMKRPLSLQDFETSSITPAVKARLVEIIGTLNRMISANDVHNEQSTIQVKRFVKMLLPSSFLQKRTWTANYAVLRNIYAYRKFHQLPEWREDFCTWLGTLPNSHWIKQDF